MRLEDLALFRDIALEKSLTRGATMNGITQSAASQHLREVEEEFQVALLDRSRRPLALTPAGKLYLEFCQEVLREKEELDAALDEFRQAVAGVVHFATIYSVGLSEVNSLQSEFRKRFPQAQLQIEYLRPEKIYEAILADRADLAVVSYPRASREIKSIDWRLEDMVVTTAPSHPLATLPSLHATHLEGQTFVSFDEDLPIQKHINRFLKEEKVTVNKVIHLDNLDSIREAVAQGSGVSIVPKPVLKSYIEQGRLVAIPLVPRSPKRPLGIIHRRRKKFSRAADAFLKILIEKGLPPQARS